VTYPPPLAYVHPTDFTLLHADIITKLNIWLWNSVTNG